MSSFRSRILSVFVLFAVVAPGQASPTPRDESAGAARASLGVADRGIFSDLDAQVVLDLPAVDSANVGAVVDRQRKLVVVYDGEWPVKVYPLGGSAKLELGKTTLALRLADRRELARLLRADRVRELARGAEMPPGDADDDGIPDPLDLLIGAKKTAINADEYVGGYYQISYPNGDVPRNIGVCTDVIIRAVRNVGTDLQRELQRDIKRSPRSYPMVKRRDPNINHRRVKTLLPYFKRTWDRRAVALDDARDPLRPGDVVFMDTFPSKPGPDHIGIVSDRVGDSGHPLVVNNWTDGSHTEEMDLLGWVPVTHRFRYPSRGN